MLTFSVFCFLFFFFYLFLSLYSCFICIFFTFFSLVLFETLLLRQKVGGEGLEPGAVPLALQWYLCHNLLPQVFNACTTGGSLHSTPGNSTFKSICCILTFQFANALYKDWYGCKFGLYVISCTMDYIVHGVLLFWLWYLSNIAIHSASNVIHVKLNRSSLMLCAWET